jgi:hypothetical protein
MFGDMTLSHVGLTLITFVEVDKYRPCFLRLLSAIGYFLKYRSLSQTEEDRLNSMQSTHKLFYNADSGSSRGRMLDALNSVLFSFIIFRFVNVGRTERLL